MTQFHEKIETIDVIVLVSDVKSKLFINLTYTLNKYANDKNILLIK